jgi:hypothetical protein
MVILYIILYIYMPRRARARVCVCVCSKWSVYEENTIGKENKRM